MQFEWYRGKKFLPVSKVFFEAVFYFKEMNLMESNEKLIEIAEVIRR